MGVEGLLQQSLNNKMETMKNVKSIKEIRKEIGVQMQDRRNFLNGMMNLQNSEKSIGLQKEFIEQMEDQFKSGKIEERDRFGNTQTKNQLGREISSAKFSLGQMELNLDYAKEDLYNKFYGKDGLMDKAGSIEKLKENITNHYKTIREEYKKIITKLE